MTQALEAKHLAHSTLFILTAKHGQSPADYSKLKKIGNTVSGVLGALVADLLQFGIVGGDCRVWPSR